MKITEEVLKELGFIQQNSSYIWDYSLGPPHDNVIRISKYNEYEFHIKYNKSSSFLVDVMEIVRFLINVAYLKGVTETQDKLSDALGLHRLLEERLRKRLSDRD